MVLKEKVFREENLIFFLIKHALIYILFIHIYKSMLDILYLLCGIFFS